MKRLMHPWLLLSLANGAWASDDLPVTVLPPVTTVAEESSASPSPTVSPSHPDLGIELPPVDASVLKAAQLQAAASNAVSTTSIGPQHILVKPGINELMPIAVGHLNRLVTPFEHPVVTTTSQATTSTKGKIVYVATADETPVTLYITPGDNQDIALSLTLIPKRIPAREIHLDLDKDSYQLLNQWQRADSASRTTSQQEQAYISQLKTLFQDLGLQKTPAGYSLRAPKPQEQIRCLQDRVQIKTGQVLEGQDRLILVGLAKNTGGAMLEFDERSCATTQQDVLAISVWPNVVLKPQEATELYVVVRQAPEASVSLRPSLLNGGQR
ncbi:MULTISPECIES: TraK domain-containing protein [Methylomonas]|uniref:TraK protein n=2 Tax=Methylomonas TaxID=416 RepID=A0A140E507_9GAMM|nr:MULTISPECIES: type-F conjugative transfer system secretin TraK [Methylomonas]AMK75481.1 TraK protein [Methylomonas denitrificans]OAI01888.1 TraK protein [Methylomonas methanica]TCV80013.1 conjugal transfer pilus assembly protein TraK [Methylomonas methanica]